MKRIKKVSRSEAAGLRRKGLHLDRVRGAGSPADRVDAARHYLLSQFRHVAPEVAENAADRVASVLVATAESLEHHRIDLRKG